MPSFEPSIFVAGPDHRAILEALARALPAAVPTKVFGTGGTPPDEHWQDDLLSASFAAAEWFEPESSVGAIAGQGVTATFPGGLRSRDAVLELLDGVAWETLTLPSHAALWALEFDYEAPTLADGHPPHGWACAFRGAGHDRLVSRRWLGQQGDWQLHRDDASDISFVQFHDPALPPLDALAQARAGQELIGITDHGGWLQSAPLLPGGVEGLYEADMRTFKVVVPPGRDVPPLELLAICQIRLGRRDDPAEPIDRLVYVFLDERAARTHARDLWLREIECWAIVDGDEVRIDEG